MLASAPAPHYYHGTETGPCHPEMNLTPRVTASVELVSKVQRPWVFQVEVRGEPPHAWIRSYTIIVPDSDAAPTDAQAAAATKGMELFISECRPIPGEASCSPRARRIG